MVSSAFAAVVPAAAATTTSIVSHHHFAGVVGAFASRFAVNAASVEIVVVIVIHFTN